MKKTSEPLISIIVPVYQVEQYLRTCLDSIVEQSHTNFELILVDDGSSDGSESICDDYAAKDCRIRVIHQQNSGLSAARNRGIEESCGEYISFVDSDDVMLHRDYLKELLYLVEYTSSQISVCGSISFADTDSIPAPKLMFEDIKVISGRELLLGYKINYKGYYPLACTARLFRKECFKNIRFPSGISSEDDAISAQLLLDVDRIAYSGLAMYGYRSRSGSITHTRGWLNYYKDQIRIADWHNKFYISRGERKLAELSEQHINKYRLLCLLPCTQIEDVKEILDIGSMDPAQIISAWSRSHVWNLIHICDPNHLSVCAEYFFEDELNRIRTIMTLVKALLYNEKRISWDILYPDMHNIISMAEDEKLAVLVCKALRTYDELPDSYRTKYEAFENQSIRNALKSPMESTSNVFAALYPHPWYREKRNESQVYLADIVDVFLLISANSEMTDKDILNEIIKSKFHSYSDIVLGLYDKLFMDDNPAEAFCDEEMKFLLEILNSHVLTK